MLDDGSELDGRRISPRPAGSRRCGCATTVPSRSITRRRASFRSSNRSRCSIARRASSATIARHRVLQRQPRSSIGKSRDDLADDVRSGVICSPNNFAYEPSRSPRRLMRITALANYDRWHALPEDEYQREKAAARRSDCMHRPCGSFPISAHASSTPTCSRPRRSAASPATTTARSTAHPQTRRRHDAPRRTCSSAAPTRASSASSAR